MALQTKSKQFTLNAQRIAQMRATIGGEDVLKGKTKEYSASDFLPKFYPETEENKKRYLAYVLRAVYYNYVGWTHAGLLGSIFRKTPNIELNPQVEYALEDIDGAGNGLEQFSKQVASEVLEVGRIGLLTDYPMITSGLSVEQINRLNPTATIKKYLAESMYNEKEEVESGSVKLTQVRLIEYKSIKIDEFTDEVKKVFRVLSLDADGDYMQNVYNEEDKLIEGPIYPRDAKGNMFSFIPFQFIGAEDNRASVDKPPLLDISNINLGHFRNSADNEENLFVHGQGTIFLGSNLTVEQFKKANPNGIQVGARAGHFLGANGNAQLLQLTRSANQEAMDAKVVQMIGIGARFIQDKSGAQTAEAAKIGAAQQGSGLTTLVTNVSEGISNCLAWANQFMGGKADNEFELNTDFFDAELTAQEVSAIILLSDAAHLAESDINHLIKRAGWLRSGRTVEDIKSEIEETGV